MLVHFGDVPFFDGRRTARACVGLCWVRRGGGVYNVGMCEVTRARVWSEDGWMGVGLGFSAAGIFVEEDSSLLEGGGAAP